MGAKSRNPERFARMTDSLLQHPAVTTLSHAAFRVLTVLAIGARSPGLNPRKDPGRNGIQAITDAHARKYGFSGRDTVYRALAELQERGLIVKTREGHRSKLHFALYAVSWLPITHRHGQPLDFAEPAPLGYLRWQPPARAKRAMPNRWKKLEMPSDDRTQFRPMIGQDGRVCRPMDASKSAICRPMAGNTLRILGDPSVPALAPECGPASTRRHLSQVAATPLPAADRIRKLRAELPHLTDADVARVCKCAIEEVQQARGIA